MIINSKRPLVSIITVVYNGVDFIEETIQSVIGQTYENVEYLVIDGGSTDGTLEIIKKYKDQIQYFISEKDNGIYDAMNKGIKAATGQWFNFLNAGDSFIEHDVLEKIFSSSIDNATLIYGDIKVLHKNGESHLHYASPLTDDMSLKRGMKVCHQAIFYNRKIMEDYALPLGSEWRHLIHMTRKQGFIPKKFDFPFVYYRTGGVSEVQQKQGQKEFKKIFLAEYGRVEYIKHIPFFTYKTTRRLLKKLLIQLKIIELK